MKVALLADIHGNADAAAAVAAALRAQAVDRVIVAGDIVGYYYFPDRVIDILSEWDSVMVRGNHEDMLTAWCAGQSHDAIVARYGSGLDAAARCLTRNQVLELGNLPKVREIELEDQKVLVCHGSPWDHDEYIYPDADECVRRRLFSGGHDLVVFGHTHHPTHWSSQDCTAINPGSVGQPRDRMPGACWALWNTSTRAVQFRRETYDTTALIAECRRRDPHLPYLADVLTKR